MVILRCNCKKTKRHGKHKKGKHKKGGKRCSKGVVKSGKRKGQCKKHK